MAQKKCNVLEYWTVLDDTQIYIVTFISQES